MGGHILVLDANDEIIDSISCSYSGLSDINGFLLRAAVAYLSSLQTSSNSAEPGDLDIERAISTLKTFIREPGTMPRFMDFPSFGWHGGMDMASNVLQGLNFDPMV